MRYTRILSAIAAASLAVSPISMNVYAQGENTANEPVQTSPTVTDEEVTVTTAPVTTEATTSTTVTTTEEPTLTVTTYTTEATTTTSTKTTTKTTSTKANTTTKATTTKTSKSTTTTTKVTTTTVPADTSVKVQPVCEHVINADINGKLYISIPEDVTAKVDIVYASPEYDSHEYYNSTLSGGKTYSFAIEGRDTTDDDYRDYTLTVSLTGGKFNLTSDSYTHTFNVPDGNDNPDSFRTVKYNFTVDDMISDDSFTIVKDEENEKEIAVHFNSVVLGDVNGDNSVDASDASLILTEYAMTSTGASATFDARQRAAADVNKDKLVNSSDASKVLGYYAEISTGGKPSWD